MHLRLKRLDEHQFASINTSAFDPFLGERWEWIKEQVAEEFSCRPSDVSSIDTDDEFDLICVAGEPAARMVVTRGLGK